MSGLSKGESLMTHLQARALQDVALAAALAGLTVLLAVGLWELLDGLFG